jgi:hypothetical protein
MCLTTLAAVAADVMVLAVAYFDFRQQAVETAFGRSFRG